MTVTQEAADSRAVLPPSSLSIGVRARDTSQLNVKLAAASELELAGAWLYDSGRCIEAYAALGAAVVRHPDLTMGIAVTNFVTRHIVVIANALATAANISSHGVRIVLGRGDSAVKFIGQKPQPVAEFEADLRILRDLLAGERVSVGGTVYRLPEPPAKDVGIYVAADGPRMWEIAGRLADGALVGKSTLPGHLDRALEAIRNAALSAGRAPDAVPVCAWVHGSAAADRKAAIDGLWPEVGRSVMHAIRSGRREVPESVKRELLEISLRQDKEFELSARLRDLFGDDILDDYTVVGTYEQCHRRLAALLRTNGVAEVAVNPYPAVQGAGINQMLREVMAAR